MLRSPMSPFRSSNDDCDQMFQLSLADIQSNGSVIPLQSNILSCLKYLVSVILVPDAIKARKVNNTNRFYSQPTSPSTYSSSISRHSSMQSQSSSMFSSSLQSSSGQGTPVKTGEYYDWSIGAGEHFLTLNISVKHYEESLRAYKKENFNLKLKIFFLEERLTQGNGSSDLSIINANTDLKVNI